MIKYISAISFLLITACNSKPDKIVLKPTVTDTTVTAISQPIPYDTSITVIHIFVALCDNKYQGIVPVPPALGNGQDLDNNLYWGCGFGIRTYFKNSSQWMLIKRYPVDTLVLERIIFKHSIKNAYLIADAYNGQYIQQCTIDFLQSCAGIKKDTVNTNNTTAGTYGNANLIAYIGHNGLMDFTLSEQYKSRDDSKRDAIILACISRNYFAPLLSETKINPLVWTTGLMCPEAYTIHDAVEKYLNKESNENIRNAAAMAYSTYQKCSVKAAKNLLVTGW